MSRQLTPEKIRENWLIITDSEPRLRSWIARRWPGKADRNDIFQGASEVFAARFRGSPKETGKIVRVYGWLCRNAAQQIHCKEELLEGIGEVKNSKSQSLNGAIEEVLDYCRRNGKVDLAKAIWAVLRGETCCEAARITGLSSVQLHRQFKTIGRELTGAAV
jgi:hypothetical protein